MFFSHFCARFLRMSSLCQVRADTNLAIEKCYFSIISPFQSSWCEKSIVPLFRLPSGFHAERAKQQTAPVL